MIRRFNNDIAKATDWQEKEFDCEYDKTILCVPMAVTLSGGDVSYYIDIDKLQSSVWKCAHYNIAKKLEIAVDNQIMCKFDIFYEPTGNSNRIIAIFHRYATCIDYIK